MKTPSSFALCTLFLGAWALLGRLLYLERQMPRKIVKEVAREDYTDTRDVVVSAPLHPNP